MNGRQRPRVRTWRRTLRALALSGRARDAVDGPASVKGTDGGAPLATRGSGGRGPAAATDLDSALPGPSPAPSGLGPATTRWKHDTGPLLPSVPLRPQQGRLGDCWVIAAMLAIHEAAPERLTTLLTELPDGTVAVHLPAVEQPIRVDRQMPADDAGRFLYAHREGANPGWPGVLEKAIALHVAGSYGVLQRGFARFGLELLLGMRVRTMVCLPSAAKIAAWRGEGRAIAASTHPLSGRIDSAHGPLPPSHVFAVVGADPASGHVQLRNPTRPGKLLVVDARTFRRGFLSIDVTPPLY